MTICLLSPHSCGCAATPAAPDLPGDYIETEPGSATPAAPEARLREALETIAVWGAHTEDCAGDEACSCGWTEVAEYARAALGAPDPVEQAAQRWPLKRSDY